MLTRLRSSIVLPLVVLALSLGTTAVLVDLLLEEDEESARAEFVSEAHASAHEIQQELTAFAEVLQAGAGLFAASDVVSADEWRRFVERLDLQRGYAGIVAVNYAERIAPAQIEALTKRMRAQPGTESFQIWPVEPHEEHAVTVLAERFGVPFARLLGYDLMSEPKRRDTLQRARDSGRTTLSSPLTLLADSAGKPRPGLLMVMPVYRGGRTPETLDGRRDALTGYVTAAFYLDEVISDAFDDSTLPLSVSIRDADGAAPGALLYGGVDGPSARVAGPPTFTVDVPLSVAEQQWSLRFKAPRTAAMTRQGNRPLYALAAGIPLALLLFGVTWSETRLRARATQLASDMTQEVRKQAQLLDLTHDTVFLRDTSDVIRYWNRAGTDTYGFSAEEAIGRTVQELLRTQLPQSMQDIRRELQETDRWEGEVVHTRRDGTEILVASRWAVQRDARGAIEAILETNNDITERRRAEDDRRRLETSLLQAQKLEAMGTLAGGVAHDFNNILGAVLGYGELAQSEVPPDSAARRYVDSMMSAGLRAKSLVERILAFSRSGVGPRVPVHVQSVVAEALDMLSANLPDTIRVEASLDAADSAIVGDATQIHQVVVNLCTNAAQAMKAGGTMHVRLSVVSFTAAQTMITGALPAGEYVRLCVQDSGDGIEPHLRDRIFDPFFTTKGVGVGTGLGLSLVHGIVIELGGAVDMQSELGRGTTFIVYLPRQGRVQPVAKNEESLPRGKGETVMLVDDEEPLVRLGEEMLAGLGYEPVGFTSAQAALEGFRADPDRYSAVLSDETMPGMTGSQLSAQIIATRPDLPVVLMSGYAGPTLLVRARTAGVREVLSKPLAARDIARVLANVIPSQ